METQTLIDRLGEIVGPENVLSSRMDRMLYSYDASLERGEPDVVVFAGFHGRGLKNHGVGL